MSKKLSFRGKLDIDVPQRIKLSTIKGKIGYQITKFQIMSTEIGQHDFELIGKIFSKDPTGSTTPNVDLSESDLMAVVYDKSESSGAEGSNKTTIIMDNAKINQDIYIYISDVGGRTEPCNYYLELETMELSDIEATQLTLQNLRTITA